METFTLTMGTHAECANGMKKETSDSLINPDTIVINHNNLKSIHSYALSIGAESKLLNLKEVFNLPDETLDAFVWISPNFIEKCGINPDNIYKELSSMPYIAIDIFMGKQRQRRARTNNIITDIDHKEDMSCTPPSNLSVSFDDYACVKSIRSLGKHFGDENYSNFVGEVNRYDHSSSVKQGIYYHGDSERSGTWAMRFGKPMLFAIKAFFKCSAITEDLFLEIPHGGSYAMCNIACGKNWKKSSITTFRHAAGLSSFFEEKRKTEEYKLKRKDTKFKTQNKKLK